MQTTILNQGIDYTKLSVEQSQISQPKNAVKPYYIIIPSEKSANEDQWSITTLPIITNINVIQAAALCTQSTNFMI